MTPPSTPRSPRSHLVVLSLVAFGLNWPWELVARPAYAEMAGRAWLRAAPHCAAAALGDVVITLATYGVGALASGRLRWGMGSRWNVYATAALLGAASAVGIEWRALATGRWSYTGRMPVVPGLGVGLWPLLQLALLVPLAFWVANRWAGSSLPPGKHGAANREA